MAVAVYPQPDETIKAVIDAIGEGEMTPSQLIETLAKKSFSDVDIRVAIWYLISQNRLEFSESQKLRVVHAAA
jgi:hypothetical protein